MSAKIQFLGGAGTVTGSKFLLEIEDEAYLVDCGLFQGLKELRLQNWASCPVDAKRLRGVLLTHAHLDHSGYLPLLVRHGFQGPIYATAPTRDLAKVILMDSARIQEEDAELANQGGYSKHHPAQPLYTTEEAHRAMGLFRKCALKEWFPLSDRVRFRFSQSGHILGSSLIEVQTQDWTLGFTGDLGRADPLILPPPDHFERVDYLVTESTYGDRLHSPLSPLKELGRMIRDTFDRGGQILIPAFAVGRTQDLLYLIAELKAASQIPEIPVFLDSPMGINATEIFLDYPDWHRLPSDVVQRMNHAVTLVKSNQQSEEVMRRRESSIVIAGSGMLSGGRILRHLIERAPDPKNTIVLVGYQPPSTRGSLLQSGAAELKMHGQYVPVRAQVETLSTLSAHGDQRDILKWMAKMTAPPKMTWIVHGEGQPAHALELKVRDTLKWSCHVPAQGESREL